MRARVVHTTRATITATGTVTDAAGDTVAPPPAAPITAAQHDAFRFIRMSRTSEYLFDSYRNMFLALERLLSDIRPRAMRPNGKPAESEKDWFTAALQQADKLVPVAKLAPTGTQDPSDWVYINMYGAERSGLMHAKPGLYHLPQDDAGRADSGRRYAHCRITSTSWSAPTYTFSAASAASTHPAGRCLRSRSSKTWCSSLLTKNSPSPPGTMKP
jgi:hypothetical protein